MLSQICQGAARKQAEGLILNMVDADVPMLRRSDRGTVPIRYPVSSPAQKGCPFKGIDWVLSPLVCSHAYAPLTRSASSVYADCVLIPDWPPCQF